MDIITQGLLGGVLAQSVAGQGKSKTEQTKIATVIGVVAGMLADVDFFIRSSSDPLLTLEFHRHFSHSLLFIPIGAAIAMLLLWPFVHKRISNSNLYIYCLAGYSLSGVLDACTSYGTHLLWPFSDERISWNIISIIDPVFSGLLLVTLIVGLRMKKMIAARIGLLLALLYMLLGVFQQGRAESLAVELSLSRGHTITKHIIKPTLANNVLWRSVYKHDGRIYVDAVRVGWFGDNTIYEGESVDVFAVSKDMPGLSPDTILYHDIERFIVFSDGFVALDPEKGNVLGDMRYSLLPMSTKPLWGITLSNGKDKHAEYNSFHGMDESVREIFLNMLFNRCGLPECNLKY